MDQANGFLQKPDFWEFDPLNNSWIQIEDAGEEGRLDGLAFSIGDKGYFGLGSESLENKKDFWEYDLQTQSWSQRTDFSGDLDSPISIGFAINEKGYVAGQNEFWEYNPQTNCWLQRASISNADIGFSIGNRGFIIRGKECWEYIPD